MAISRRCRVQGHVIALLLGLAAIALSGCNNSRSLLENGDFQLSPEPNEIARWQSLTIRGDSKANLELRRTSAAGEDQEDALLLESRGGDFQLFQTVAYTIPQSWSDVRIRAAVEFKAETGRVVSILYRVTNGRREVLDQKELPANGKWNRIELERPITIGRAPRPDELTLSIAVLCPPDSTTRLRDASVEVTKLSFLDSPIPPSPIEVGGLLAVFIVVGAIFLLGLRTYGQHPSRMCNILSNTFLLLYTTLVLLLFLEMFTGVFMIAPDSMATTLVSQKWWQKHWKPVNEFRYRDVRHSQEDFRDKKILFVVGDSFTAGHGIRRFEDTFSQLLARRLGNEWRVVVIARPGLHTEDELRELRSYPAKPDLVILAHVWNDVHFALWRHGVALPERMAVPDSWAPILSRSYLLDFIYWRIRGLRPRMNDYLETILTGYRDEEIWQTHEELLFGFIEFTKGVEAPLLVAAFPALDDIASSRITSSRVVDYFRSHGVPAIDLADVFKGRKPSEITVNPFDSHPNEAAHQRIADELYDNVQNLLNSR